MNQNEFRASNESLNGRLGHVVEHIRPGGGPSGYLYNLNQIAMQHPERKFDVLFISASSERNHWQGSAKFQLLLRMMRPLTPGLRSLLLLPVQFMSAVKQPKLAFNSEFNELLKQYSCLVFHDAGKAKIYIENSAVEGQRILVMPHSPSDLSLESLEDYENFLGGRIKKSFLLSKMRSREIELYEKIDGVVAPSKYALEGYFSDDVSIRRRFDHILVNNLYEVVTGVDAKKASRRMEYREKVNPSGKKYVVGYFGRFNEQKGFDRYLRLAKALENEIDIQFVCAGAGGLDFRDDEYKNLNNLGWVSDDIAEYMAAVDLIVSPNRVCYFDLAVLEALSLGTPILASAVGGNKYFQRFDNGIYLFNSEVEMIDKMLYILRKPPRTEIVHELFKANFSSQRFFDNHQALSVNLLGTR